MADTLLERFASVASEAADPAAGIEAVRDKDRLLFRQGARDARFWRTFARGFALVVAVLMIPAIYHFLPASVSWLPIGLMLLATGWWLLKVPILLAQRTHFLIDPDAQAITVHPPVGPVQVLPLDRIDCFVCGWVGGETGVNAKLYAIEKSGDVHDLTEGIQDREAAARQTALLGHITEKQALLLKEGTGIWDSYEGGPGVLKRKVDMRRLLASSSELRCAGGRLDAGDDQHRSFPRNEQS